jgi:metal-responsive CopG/Arc/MetJ family transcriptional regulator
MRTRAKKQEAGEIVRTSVSIPRDMHKRLDRMCDSRTPPRSMNQEILSAIDEYLTREEAP